MGQKPGSAPGSQTSEHSQRKLPSCCQPFPCMCSLDSRPSLSVTACVSVWLGEERGVRQVSGRLHGEPPSSLPGSHLHVEHSHLPIPCTNFRSYYLSAHYPTPCCLLICNPLVLPGLLWSILPLANPSNEPWYILVYDKLCDLR